MSKYDLHPSTIIVNKAQKLESKKARISALAWLANTFPQAFDNTTVIRPIKIGIMQDIFMYSDQAKAAGISKSKLREAIVVFTRRLDYLICLKAKEMRIDLHGHPVSIVTDEEAEKAAIKVKRRIENAIRNNSKNFINNNSVNKKIVTDSSLISYPLQDYEQSMLNNESSTNYHINQQNEELLSYSVLEKSMNKSSAKLSPSVHSNENNNLKTLKTSSKKINDEMPRQRSQGLHRQYRRNHHSAQNTSLHPDSSSNTPQYYSENHQPQGSFHPAYNQNNYSSQHFSGFNKGSNGNNRSRSSTYNTSYHDSKNNTQMQYHNHRSNSNHYNNKQDNYNGSYNHHNNRDIHNDNWKYNSHYATNINNSSPTHSVIIKHKGGRQLDPSAMAHLRKKLDLLTPICISDENVK